jgi:hypothetical protein
MYTKEMGPPPVDIDQASALPPAQRKAAERKAAEQTKKDYPKSKPPAKKAKGGMTKGYAKGGVTRADGCAVKGHTRGRMV